MKLSSLKPQIKLSIENPESEQGGALLGPGVAALCRGVRDIGSLNAAAKGMGMAYSKAWRIIKETEDALGMQMLVRDGAHGSTLTPECTQLIEAYDALQEKLDAFAQETYQKLV